MGVASASRALLSACVAFIAAPVLAGTPGRDKAWEAAIAQAKAHGGVETRLDRSVSYVFRRPDGSYLSLTRLLQTDKGRSVCLIAKDENATACVDWDTGKLRLGSRADAATPWSVRSFEFLDAFEKAQPGFAEQLLSSLQDLVLRGGPPDVGWGFGGGGGYGGGGGGHRGGGSGMRRH
jgi:hypothetical protein